jgi:hypothetical protein
MRLYLHLIYAILDFRTRGKEEWSWKSSPTTAKHRVIRTNWRCCPGIVPSGPATPERPIAGCSRTSIDGAGSTTARWSPIHGWRKKQCGGVGDVARGPQTSRTARVLCSRPGCTSMNSDPPASLSASLSQVCRRDACTTRRAAAFVVQPSRLHAPIPPGSA